LYQIRGFFQTQTGIDHHLCPSVDTILLPDNALRVTTKLSAKGHVLIPKAVRQEKRLEAGDDFEVLTTIRGDIVLRRMRRPRKSLAQHMRGLKGLILPNRDDPMPRPIEL
jgi:AbrB family looped-hinge helix DNA binding protein